MDNYKWNFTPEKSDLIPQLHERVAQRVYDLMTSNGGLYIKIGQAIGANAAVLPKPMQVKFASLFDDAPQIPYSVVHDVCMRELGRPPSGPGGVFEIFEEKAVASASIAQVHKAKLWPRVLPDGTLEKEERWVAVKVQKPDVAKQMVWDLGAYRAVMWMFENWAFDLPVYFAVDFVSEHLKQELDFVREADNARQTAEFIASEPTLRDKVYIPVVYPELSTKRIMVAEWIDGVRLSDKPGVYRLMGEKYPSLSASTIDPASATSLVASPSSELSALPNSPTSVSSLQFPSKPLKGGLDAVLLPLVQLFCAQMFDWGWVHCDPHPGNILVRPNPVKPSVPQIVLLDHGLYVRVPDGFKHDWVKLWRALLAKDFHGVEEVTKVWGFGVPDLMASFMLMRPTVLKKDNRKGPQPPRKPLTQYEISVKMKQKLKEFLMDTDRMPKVLIFLTRNMRMVQGNNQSFGSPVNRIKVTGLWASRSLSRDTALPFSLRVREYIYHLRFRFLIFGLDVLFWRAKATAFIGSWVERIVNALGIRRWGLGWVRRGNFEEELEKTMRGFAKDSLGFDVGSGAFEG
ncbi:ABC1 family protein lscO [Psilocybe cubensis]|uniref:ABC1 family protein lscO n=1 Tax=Psilocybe cubensis TaxID=181762 RepID=A0ACB8H0S0_PSICU|nr:ABC1 family protein lscO [Psilocybe cubensis]KAH9481461.1 ABC1 family protein lscO [Psilocybe cubensis]